MNVLVVGGYGLIGRQIVSELTTQSFTVTGMGRSAHKGQQVFPDIKWLSGDLHKLCTPEDWETYLSGIDAVVNASGALQSGLRDNLQAIQSDAIRAL
ncbi:MAG: NAD(P)H-binding protein, partial [Rhizobiaceae bacterium]|nr:NAD(P)H-binding protein [Rhizobiaceae bacterium]